ncbi:hypothetical protein L1077_21760 [Pseudoalteromonas luteoviolacea]|uniref:hypothetical protein n=1 Tax=Pseudoalteromonas luteoviolacea TaxID=43657 RepID=UPI001F3193C8|nr:hypothetical protein [Pseudoalteromonas luteoviolacea]MCF6442060.1 hypothetical protein [Pseudoalteromonas luteoviolacea]
MAKCRKAAIKKVNDLRGDDAPNNANDWEVKVAELQQDLFEKAKPTSISGELSMPSSVDEYIAQAKKLPDQFRNLKGMKKVPVLDAEGGGNDHQSWSPQISMATYVA